MTKRILLTGGGTGGHLFPLVAVAQKLKKLKTENIELFFVGSVSPGIDILEKEGIKINAVAAGKLRRSWRFWDTVDNGTDFLKLIFGFFQVFWRVWRIMPDVIFSKGGYGSFTVVVVGWIYHIPIILHESDSVPGITNRLLGKLAKNIAISFERSAAYFKKGKCALTGNPVREELLQGNAEEAKRFFQLQGGRPVLFIFGGSQGSQSINLLILKILAKIIENFEIIHQCGDKNYEEIKSESDKLLSDNARKYYHLYPFLRDELKHVYAVCDLIISRAGASNIFEIAAAGKASILIPFPDAASDHQNFNAFDYARSGAAVVLTQENLTENMLLNKIEYLAVNNELRQKMESRAKDFARLDAAEKIAGKILEIILVK